MYRLHYEDHRESVDGLETVPAENWRSLLDLGSKIWRSQDQRWDRLIIMKPTIEHFFLLKIIKESSPTSFSDKF